MSWVGDLLTSVRSVLLLEDRVTRLDASIAALAVTVADTRDRVIRLEGLIEGAIRTYRTTEQPHAPPVISGPDRAKSTREPKREREV